MSYQGFFASRTSGEWCGNVGVYATEEEALTAARRAGGGDCNVWATPATKANTGTCELKKPEAGEQFIRKAVSVKRNKSGEWEILGGPTFQRFAEWDEAVAYLQGVLEKEYVRTNGTAP